MGLIASYVGPRIRPPPPAPPRFHLNVIISSGGRERKQPIPVGPFDTWAAVKNKISGVTGKSPDSFLLNYQGRPVRDGERVLNVVTHNHAKVLCTVHKDSFVTGRGFGPGRATGLGLATGRAAAGRTGRFGRGRTGTFIRQWYVVKRKCGCCCSSKENRTSSSAAINSGGAQ